MWSWVRLLVVWCMAIALPLQGLAGVGMLHCGDGQAMVAVIAADAAAHHDHDEHHAAGHHGHAAADGAARDQPGAHGDPSPHTCSACAACCASSALPSAIPRLPRPADVPAVFNALVVSVDRFATDGPDRPPRPRLD